MPCVHLDRSSASSSMTTKETRIGYNHLFVLHSRDILKNHLFFTDKPTYSLIVNPTRAAKKAMQLAMVAEKKT